MLQNVSDVSSVKEKLVYSVKELAEMTTLSPEYLYTQIKTGKLKAKVFGRRRLIFAQDAMDYLNNAMDFNAKKEGQK